MARDPDERSADLRAQLTRVAKRRKADVQLTLTHYVLERLLYRLGISPHAKRFVLKGAMLQTLWIDDPFRPTRDLDLLGYGDSGAAGLKKTFAEIIAVRADDGVAFDTAALSVEPIRQGNAYGGMRVGTRAAFAGADIKIQIDIGFGDVVTPAPVDVTYPVLIDLPAPRIRAYPKETVIAEKFQAIVDLGERNSRMKDFYDIWMMSRHLAFDGATLASAISATFARRQTSLPHSTPIGLSDAFARSSDARRLWTFFTTRNLLSERPRSFAETLRALRRFLMPACGIAAGRRGDAPAWTPGGPWADPSPSA